MKQTTFVPLRALANIKGVRCESVRWTAKVVAPAVHGRCLPFLLSEQVDWIKKDPQSLGKMPPDANERGKQLAHEAGEATAHSVSREDRAQKLKEIGRNVVEEASKTPEGREWLKKDFDAELYDENGLPT